MAGRPTRQVNRYNRYVQGSAAYDYDALERERERERSRREYVSQPAETPPRRETTARQTPRRLTAPKHRERQHVSFFSVLGFAATGALIVMLLLNYAQLAAISNSVVSMKNEIADLQEEHVALVARYERTFDLTAVKAAAEAAGMAKPSASQIYYVDLSAPDNVILYRQKPANALSRVFTSLGQDVVSMVEYFK